MSPMFAQASEHTPGSRAGSSAGLELIHSEAHGLYALIGGLAVTSPAVKITGSCAESPARAVASTRADAPTQPSMSAEAGAAARTLACGPAAGSVAAAACGDWSAVQCGGKGSGGTSVCALYRGLVLKLAGQWRYFGMRTVPGRLAGAMAVLRYAHCTGAILYSVI